MRRKQTQMIGDVIREFLRNSELNKKVQETQVINYWHEMMGKNISDATKSIYIINQTLYIQIYSSIIRNELFMLREKIRERLNKKVGFDLIKKIVIR